VDRFSHELLAFGAAFAAGAINSVAGGGTLISFPTLIWLGLPSIVANATNTVAIWPGSLASAWAYRRELTTVERRIWVLVAPSLIGGIVGALLLGQLFDRFSPFVMLAVTYLAASAFVLLIGIAGVSIVPLVLTVFGAGFCVVGGQIGANALTANSYPTPIRSTGVGWALGIGRIGSIIGPAVGGLLLSLHWPMRQIFLVGAAPLLIAALASLCVSFLRRSPQAEQAVAAAH